MQIKEKQGLRTPKSISKLNLSLLFVQIVIYNWHSDFNMCTQCLSDQGMLPIALLFQKLSLQEYNHYSFGLGGK